MPENRIRLPAVAYATAIPLIAIILLPHFSGLHYGQTGNPWDLTQLGCSDKPDKDACKQVPVFLIHGFLSFLSDPE
jgi:hypothetical protein